MSLRLDYNAATPAGVTAFIPLLIAAIALGGSPAISQNRDQVRVAFEHALPNVEGKRMVAVVVNYPPGGRSLPHRHAASAFIYAHVLSGAAERHEV
jgi:quercetin dioxygenase-like cupin family protein